MINRPALLCGANTRSTEARLVSNPWLLRCRFKLKQEQENRRNASMLYDGSRDKLRRAEEQQQAEVEERQKVDLALRSLELERRTLLNNMKQVRTRGFNGYKKL